MNLGEGRIWYGKKLKESYVDSFAKQLSSSKYTNILPSTLHSSVVMASRRSQTSLQKNLCFFSLSAHFPFSSPLTAIWALPHRGYRYRNCSFQGLLVTKSLGCTLSPSSSASRYHSISLPLKKKFIWPCLAVCGNLVRWPEIEFMLALGVWHFNHWAIRDVPPPHTLFF